MKTKQHQTPFVLTLLVLIVAATGLSAAPPGFTYQGRLTTAGNPASGLYDMTFELYDDPASGTLVDTGITNAAVAVSNGVFTTTLVFDPRVFDGNQRWLQIGVRLSGGGVFTPLAPRQEVTPAPWALQALTASSALSVPAQTITSAMLANSAVTASKIAPGVLTHLDASDGSPANALVVNTNGLIGIGTGTPAAGLQVSSAITNLIPTFLSEVVDGIGQYSNLNANVSVAVSGTLLALGSSGDNAVTLVNIATPNAPSLNWSVTDGTGSYTNLGGVAGLALSGNLLAIASLNDNAVTLVDVTVPSSPNYRVALKDGVGSYTSLGGAYGVNLTSNVLAISAFTDSAFTLVDVTAPASPVFRIAITDGQLGFDDLGGACALARSGNLLAIAAANDNAVTLVDVTNPSNPIRLATLKDGVGPYANLANPRGLAFSGNVLAIAAFTDNAVTLVDVSVPTAPVLLASLRNGVGGYVSLAAARDVQFQGSRLWIGAASGLTAVNVANPAAPGLEAVVANGTRGFNHLGNLYALGVSGNTVAAGGFSAATLLNGATTGAASLVADGWVGIGVSQPAAALHVNGSVLVENASSLLMQGSAMSIHSGKAGLRGSANGWVPGMGDTGIFIEGGTGESGGFYADGDVAVIWSPGDLDLLRVYDEDTLPTGAPKFVIDGAGYVGILTNNPATALHVVGTATATAVNATTANATTVNATTVNATTVNATTVNATTVSFANGTAMTSTPATFSGSSYGLDLATTNRFLSATVFVTVTSTTQKILVTSFKAFGTTTGATGLNLYIGYRVNGSSSAPTALGSGVLNNALPANSRVPMGLSYVISGLAPGTYEVGLVGYAATPANWNWNEYGYTTAVVF